MQSGEEEPGSDFSKLVIGPPKDSVELARRIGGVAVSNFEGIPPDVYQDVYVVHAPSLELLEPLLKGARYIFYLGGPLPPPRSTAGRLIVVTCNKNEICGEADCLCGGALRI